MVILMRTFYQWIQNLKSKNTPIGDFACAVSFDQDHPQINTLAAWKKHLKAVNANLDNFQILEQDAWPQYTLYQRNNSDMVNEISQDAMNNCPQPNDEYWTIQRPVLPNYWGNISLMRVCCNALKGKNLAILAVPGKMYCQAVEQFGKYFRREFKYDFLPYTVSEHCKHGDEFSHPYLFIEPNHNLFIHANGACEFHFSKERNKWTLNWVWLHPFARRQGYLSKTWSYFCQLYGDFELEYPLSDVMKTFLTKQNKFFKK